MQLVVVARVADLIAPICLAAPLTLEDATHRAETASPRVVAEKLDA